MNKEDMVEIPIQRCLYRQSSVETRLTPQPPSESSDSEEDTPKIVGVQKKVNTEESNKNYLIENEKSSSPTHRTSFPVYAQVDKNTKKQESSTYEDDVVSYGTIEDVKPKTFKPEILPKPSKARLSQSFEEEESNKPFVPVYADVTTPKRNPNRYPTNSEPLYEVPEYIEEKSPVLTRKSQISNEQYENRKTRDSYVSFAGTVSDSRGVGNMATLRPKSPRPPVAAKQDKEESLWDKIGTLGRKKRIKEVREVEAEGKNAIDSPGNPVNPDYPPEEYELDEKEERCMVDTHALEDPKVKDLIQILIDWINDELAEQRIIVQDIMDDLYDGQVLQKLLEKLTGNKLNEPEVTQSEEGQKQKLAMVLDDFNRILGIPHHSIKKWGVESIHSKNIVAILYLLVALARHFRAPIRLPEHVTIKTHVVQKSNGQLNYRTAHEHVTSAYDDVGMRCERDAFDTLFDHAPEKLQVVKKSMVTFVNKHLNKINLEVTDLETQFSDGVYLVLLMGLLEGFFVPLHCFSLTPKDFDQKVHNVSFAFDLMEEVGISRPKARPEDIVNLDLKSTLRVLYKLFSKYKDII
nr:beta-parvin [Onthophagus taurus]